MTAMQTEQERVNAKRARQDGRKARRGLVMAMEALDDLTDSGSLTGAEREAVVEALGKTAAALSALNLGAGVLSGLSPATVETVRVQAAQARQS